MVTPAARRRMDAIARRRSARIAASSAAIAVNAGAVLLRDALSRIEPGLVATIEARAVDDRAMTLVREIDGLQKLAPEATLDLNGTDLARLAGRTLAAMKRYRRAHIRKWRKELVVRLLECRLTVQAIADSADVTPERVAEWRDDQVGFYA